MSYCVNCGVELDQDLKVCPLCNTPVFNPREVKTPGLKNTFPLEKGHVEEVKRKDLGLFLSIMLLTIGITCMLLNFLVFSQNRWSFIVVGICFVLWVFCIPFVILRRIPVYMSLFLDGVSTVALLYCITYLTQSRNWFWGLGLPIVILCTIIAELFAICMKKIKVTFLSTMLYVVIAVALLCTGIEMLIDLFIKQHISLSWSAVVLTVCAILSILLINLLSIARLRNAVRRRLHF